MHVLRGWNLLGITGSHQQLDVPGMPGWQGLERRGLWDAVHVRGVQPGKLFDGWARSMRAVPCWQLLDRLWAGIVHGVPNRVEHCLDWVELVVAVQVCRRSFGTECLWLQFAHVCIA